MTSITAHAGNAAARFDAAFSAFVAFCADFCAGARQGQEIADRYRELSRKSTPELNKLGLTRTEIPRAALKGTLH
jgi:uncharacterized protein YjiS (DUF1127 family)